MDIADQRLILKEICFISGDSHVIPLNEDWDKYKEAKVQLRKVKTREDLTKWFDLIENMDVIDRQNQTWKCFKIINKLI